jgi:hypothetical protein
MVVVVILAAFVVGGSIALLVAMSRRRRDTAALRAVAQRFGWSYKGRVHGWQSVLGGTPPGAPLGYGRTGRIRHVIEGPVDGATVTLFHLEAFNAVSGRGAAGMAAAAALKNRTEHTVGAVRLPGPTAQMTVAPPADWAARRVDPGQLPNRCATGDPWFDQQFVVTSIHPAAAARALTPDVRQAVASFWVPFAADPSGYLLTWRAGYITDGDQLWAQSRGLVYVASLLANHR